MKSDYVATQARMTNFGASVLRLVRPLKEAGVPGSVVDQFLRSASAVGANFAEARAAESRADFAHKLQIALKECREAKHWLELLRQPFSDRIDYVGLAKECDELCAILYRSLLTTKNALSPHK